MQRIVIVGTTGSGKSTLASALSQRLAIRHIEVDALHWLPDWQEEDREVTRRAVAHALSQAEAGWVVDGNYSFIRDLVWEQADSLIWLDYPLIVSQWRLFWRTVQRIRSRELLWEINQENFRTQFMTRDSLFWWAIKSRRKHRRDYPLLFQQPEYQHLKIIRLYSPHETEAWLRTI